jgi:pseudaminic acid cytidylyltransferase
MIEKLCIIPARGGSKRIPRKNIKNFLGKPIIAYSIEAAIESGLFDEVMVSTDDEEIAKIARQYGAKVPFFRSKKTADDFATIENVIKEVLDCYEKKGQVFDNFCCVSSTNPLLKTDHLSESYFLFSKSNFDSLFPVIRYSYPIQRALKLQDEKIVMAQPNFIHSRSQDLEPMFHDAGMFYWMKSKIFSQKLEIICDNTGMFELSELEVQDIDNDTDWVLAELKFQFINKYK